MIQKGLNWLDLIITTTSSACSNCHMHAPIATSDHNLIICEIALPYRNTQNNQANTKIYHRIIYQILQSKLEHIN